MSGLLILGNPMMAHAQQTKTTTAESISTESCSTENILTKKEGLLQDSIQAMKEKVWANKRQWAQMSLVNIAHSERFDADKTIERYASEIWHLDKVEVDAGKA